MSMVISTNMSALNTANQLTKNNSLMNSSLEKLSSGYAINSAADDAAGLAISEKMRAQIQGLNQASDNSQDAISLTQTADGALDETNEILKRMRELAVKASSDTLTDDDRQAVQDEVDQLRQEIDRISNDTEYNTKKLLNGDSGSEVTVSGTNSAAIVAGDTTAGNNTTSGTYEVKYTSVATQAISGADNTSDTGIDAITDSADAFAGDIEINGTTVTIEQGDTIEGVVKKINDVSSTTGVTASVNQDDTGNMYVELTNATYGSDSTITLKAKNDTLDNLFNAVSSTDTTTTSVTVTGKNASGTINGAIATADGNTLTSFDLTVTGDDATLSALYTSFATDHATEVGNVTTATSDLTSDIAAADTANGDTALATLYSQYLAGTKSETDLRTAFAANDTADGTTLIADLDALKTAQEALAAIPVATADVTVDTSSALTFQIGANTDQTMTLSIGDMDADALGVAGDSPTTGIDLSTAESASDAITAIDKAISKVATARSNLGAVQNSLESNINNLDTESENLTSAESNIRDTDMAEEMSNYTKYSVITQAATAMLAKANQQPQQVLTLLQG